jgi:4-amino-4-deoxy-L-arabinose transferase-like glycosyltransferase
MRSLARGRPGDPVWVRPGLFAVLAAAAALCFWNLTINGYGNDYYAAAVRAGIESWKAWFFGALDPGSFITVDKPPLSLWVMGLSSRLFGYSSASLLVPQALATVASVGVLYATVRRAFGPAAGLLAGAMLALTPVTVAIGRFDNPDALLVLLLVSAAWLFGRALENGRTRYLAWGGAVIGLAFMTKMLQGWMVAPALFGAYLIAGPPAFWTRVKQLTVAAGVMAAVSAAWPLAVTFWPGSKPYIGGSTDGGVWNLILGYNGFGRIFGEGGRGPGGGGGGSPFGGTPGWLRMLNDQVGGQVAWLLPLALVGLVAGLWLVRRAPRTDKVRAAWLLWGGWALVHIAVFSSQKGIFHPYYVSALAPAIAALAGAGAVVLWKRAISSWSAFAALAVGVGATAWLSVVLLDRATGFAPALRWLIGVLAVAAVAGGLWLRAARDAAPGSLLSHGSRGAAVGVVVAGLLAVTLGPASYSVATVGRALSTGDVAAGPASAVRRGGPGGGMPGGPGGQAFGPPPGATAGSFGPPPGMTASGPPTGMPPGAARAGFGGPGGGGGQVSNQLISYLEAHQGSARYLVAGASSHTTGPIIIKTGKPVVTWGGFNGGDNALSVAQLEQMVRKGELRYVLVDGGGGPGRGGGGPGGGGNSSQISSWVTKHGTKVTAVSSTGGATLYRVSV